MRTRATAVYGTFNIEVTLFNDYFMSVRWIWGGKITKEA